LHNDSREQAVAKIEQAIKGIVPISAASGFSEPEPPFPQVASQLVTSTTPFPISLLAIDRKGFLNCVTAFETFEEMLTQAACARILLLHGHGNQGKSTLISTLYNHTRTVLGLKSAARVEFKKAGSTPEEHLLSIARSVGVAAHQGGTIIQKVDALLDACASKPTVLFFDAYEHAEHQHRHWVVRILERSRDDDHIRCVVAGREVPAARSQPWANMCVTAECDALQDKDAFKQHALAKGYQGPPEDIIAMVTTCVMLREKYHREGKGDHGISSEYVIQEIEALCKRGAKLS
jgi:hypothetical protein